MGSAAISQKDRAIALLEQCGMLRLSEFTYAGITAATIQRLERQGGIVQLGRGLYQLPDAPLEQHHSLAEAAKHVPKGIISLSSALAFHELTDQIPSRVWVAIGSKDWRPVLTDPPVQIVRFGPKVFGIGIEEHVIEKVAVKIYDPAKTVVDLFRYRQRAGQRFQQSPGLAIAIEGMRQGLRAGKATPAKIARYAQDAGIWKIIEPYLDAMVGDA